MLWRWLVRILDMLELRDLFNPERTYEVRKSLCWNKQPMQLPSTYG